MDSRYNLNYSMSSIGLSLSDQVDMYGGNPVAALGGRPPSGGLIQTMGGGGVGLTARPGSLMPNASQCQPLGNSTPNSGGPGGGHQQQRGIKRTSSDCYDDHHRGGSAGLSAQSLQGLESCSAGGNGQHAGQQQQQQQQGGGNVPDVVDDSYNSLQNKKSPPANGKKTKGRVKIKMEYIDNKLRRYTTFSKRKTGIMKKAYELSTLTGTQVMLLVASETGHVYTFATRKLQPMITSEAGKQLIQTCLNSPDPPSVGGGDQRMSATGFEETELSYNIADEDSKDGRSPLSSGNESDESSDIDSPVPAKHTIESTFSECKNSTTITAAATGAGMSTTTATTISGIGPTATSSGGGTVATVTSLYESTTGGKVSSTKGIGSTGNCISEQLRPDPPGLASSTAGSMPPLAPASASASIRASQASTTLATSVGDAKPTTYRAHLTAKGAKQQIIASTTNNENFLYSPSTLANMPQDVLLQLIHSGHLQLHTDKDGSSQYVTIPITSAAVNLVKTPAKNSNPKSMGTDSRNSPRRLDKNRSNGASAAAIAGLVSINEQSTKSGVPSTSISNVLIKEEFE